MIFGALNAFLLHFVWLLRKFILPLHAVSEIDTYTLYIIMAELEVKELDQVVVRFSGDSGDGMQLAGNIFSTVSATVGNG